MVKIFDLCQYSRNGRSTLDGSVTTARLCHCSVNDTTNFECRDNDTNAHPSGWVASMDYVVFAPNPLLN